MENPAPLIDHTLLRPNVLELEIETACEEAVEYGFASVCLPPVHVPLAARLLYGSEVKTCSVVGFPCGYQPVGLKIAETADLVAGGAQELDLVIHLGPLLEGKLQQVEDEIAQVVLATANSASVKVIIECCFLTPEQMRQVTERVVRGGAAFVKTSTGFGPSGARVEDVRLLADTAAGRIGVKAAGGIRDLAGCAAMLSAGATRIGSSSGVAIVQQWRQLGQR